MQLVETAQDIAHLRAHWQPSVGIVPTMGYLHQGHASLIERARRDCRTVVVSIFVNPTQFGPQEDFSQYPRDVARDLDLCRASGADVVFAPRTPAEIYPQGHHTFVDVEHLQDRWEGAARPGHFRGVATVVTLLFRIVRPAFAYFGEKDFQQLQIVRRLSQDLHLDVDIVPCPTVRESDGLACSSRNVYLSPTEREQAPALYRALTAAQSALQQGVSDAAALRALMEDIIAHTPGARLDYAAVVDPASLEPITTVESEARALLAIHLGDVHLIDNMALSPPDRPT